MALACRGGQGPQEPKTAAPQPSALRLVIDSRSLDALSLPVTTGKPFVSVTEPGASPAAVGVLMEETADHFTVFDGLASTVYSKLAAGDDSPPPPRYERVEAKQVPKLLGVAGRSELAETVRTAVFALLMKERSEAAAEDELLRQLGDDLGTVQAYVTKAVPSYLASEAVGAYSSGGPREKLERELGRVANMDGPGATFALKLLPHVKALGEPDRAAPPSTALDALIRARVNVLRDYRCDLQAGSGDDRWPGRDPVGRVRTLGFTALAALTSIQGDDRPTRCVLWPSAGEPKTVDPPSLLTIGQLATRVIHEMNGKATFDPSDIECGYEGFDEEALHLVDTALAKHDVPGAIALAKGALGNLRAKMVERIANAGGASATSFLSEEAKTGPVVLARLEAARVLGARGDVSWAAPLTVPVGGALRDENPFPNGRCDQSRVALDGFDILMRFAPADALKLASAGFPAYGPKARVRLASSLSTMMTKTAVDAKARDALLALALSDTRPFAGMTMTLGGSPCTDPSPSDVAAVHLGKRLGIPYSCAESATAKATDVQAILGKLAKP